jgi:hypothetical protein
MDFPVKIYQDLSGDSGVAGYEIGAESITVQFKSGAIYLYTYASAGKSKIEAMKRLAVRGHTLSTFISREVKELYATQIR